jgi:hypothetical protein
MKLASISIHTTTLTYFIKLHTQILNKQTSNKPIKKRTCLIVIEKISSTKSMFYLPLILYSFPNVLYFTGAKLEYQYYMKPELVLYKS